MDIVSETQQNARWLYGSRSKTSVSDKTPAEWSRSTRQLFAQNRFNWIIGFISMVSIGFILGERALEAVKNTGFSFVSVILVLFTILVLGAAALYLRKALTPSAQISKSKHHRKKAS